MCMYVCLCMCVCACVEFFLNMEKSLDGVALPQTGKREVVKPGQ